MSLFLQSIDYDSKATRLAFVAAGLWILSLCVPAIVGHDGSIPGIAILLLGWWAILGLSVAWIANIFFLWAFFRTIAGTRPPLPLAWIAILVALDTIRLTNIPVPEGNFTVFGYSWGAALWFCALLVVGIAAGLRNIDIGKEAEPATELDENPALGARGSIRVFAGALALLVVGTTALALWQRTVVAPAERERFRMALVKRGSVCSTPDVSVLGSIVLDGALEVRREPSRMRPFTNWQLLLWGVPIVREHGVDIRLDERTGGVWMTPAAGSAAAMFEVTETRERLEQHAQSHREPESRTLKASLVTRGGETLFKGEWLKVPNHVFCPTFREGGYGDDTPRTLIKGALRTAQGQALPDRSEADRGIPAAALEILSVERIERAPVEAAWNSGCSEDTGIRSFGYPSRESDETDPVRAAIWKMDTGWFHDRLLQVGDSYYQTPITGLYPQIACRDTDLYAIAAQRGLKSADRIVVEMRSLSDPGITRWSGSALFERGAINVSDRSHIRVESVAFPADRISIVLEYRDAYGSNTGNLNIELRQPSGH